MSHTKILFSVLALALEYPIGVPQKKAGMGIGAVYLQAVEMEPDGMMKKVSESDIHIEAVIHALAINQNFLHARMFCNWGAGKTQRLPPQPICSRHEGG